MECMESLLKQHRSIVLADLRGSVVPVLQFQKQEIHTVFPRLRYCILAQNLTPSFPAEFRGVALIKSPVRSCTELGFCSQGSLRSLVMEVICAGGYEGGDDRMRSILDAFAESGQDDFKTVPQGDIVRDMYIIPFHGDIMTICPPDNFQVKTLAAGVNLT